MKNRKQKVTNPKKPIQIPDQAWNNHINASNAKQFSGHTKVSTNCTIHTSVPAQSNVDKKSRNKKGNNATTKSPVAEIRKGQITSKSNRKCKLFDLPLNVETPPSWVPEESYRQYCVVDENFVPISSKNQQKLFEEFFSKTASTSYDFNYFSSLSKTKAVQAEKGQLRKRASSSRKQRCQEAKENLLTVEKQDKAISNVYVGKTYANVEIEVAAECCQIGMQYSERKQIVEQKHLVEPKPAETAQKEVASEMVEASVNSQQSLTDLLFKLEFTHLMDEKSFNALSESEKLHFSQLLESVMAKLSNKQKQIKSKQKIKPIQFDQIIERGQDNFVQTHHKPKQKSPLELITPPVTVNFQKLEEMITRRELKQKNIILDNNKNPNTIDTSLLSILNFLGHFFCFIELQYTQQFVYMIGKMYGFNFKQKYRRITRNLSLEQEKKFKVVDEALFLDFVNQSDLNLINNYEIAHFKAIFDGFNEHLQVYRPFYAGNGQQFPWSFKLFASMSEYSIDEQSLQIIFRQAKDKIFEWAQNLCGILVQYDEPLPSKNPLVLKRLQNENIFIRSCIEEDNFEKDGIQLFATQTLHEVSQDIFAQLIQQLVQDATFLFI